MTDVAHILWRSLLSFVALLIVTRVIGKKQISQLTFFDYVVGITIGNIAGSMSIDLDSIPVRNSLTSMVVWGFLPMLVAWIGLKSYWFRRVVDGTPTVVVQNGEILNKNLKHERMTTDELMHLLREKNAFRLADVEFAVMETDGKLSVLKKTDSQPITPKTEGMTVENEPEPRIVVMDGVLMNTTLNSLGLTPEWLLGELQKQGAKQYSDVFLAQVDGKGEVYVDLYEDSAHIPATKARALTAATLKKAQADLEMFALQTNVPHAKQIYSEQSKRVSEILQEMEPYLRG